MAENKHKRIKGFPTEDEVPKPFSTIPVFGKYPTEFDKCNIELMRKLIEKNSDEEESES